MAVSYIALGSNLDNPRANLVKAVDEIKALGEVTGCSSLYSTKPWGLVDQPDFCNAVIRLKTALEPSVLLDKLKDIENSMGRVETVRWGPRIIDLDILTYDDRVIESANLTLPHPRMNERAFVIVPLADLDVAYETTRASLGEAALAEVELAARDWL